MTEVKDTSGASPKGKPGAESDDDLWNEASKLAFAASKDAAAEPTFRTNIEPEDGEKTPDGGDDGEGEGEDDAGDPPADAKADEAGKDQQESDADADAEDQDEDIWKDADPKLKAAFEKERAAREKERLRAESIRGNLNKLLKSRASRPKPKRETDDDEARKAEEDALEKAGTEYGDVVGPLVKRIRDFDERFKALDKADEEEREAILRFEHDAFLEDHSDGFDVIDANKSAFVAWVEDQPKKIRDAVAINRDGILDADAASMVVSAFKQHLGTASAPPATETPRSGKRERQMNGARASKNTSPPHSTEPAGSTTEDADWNFATQQLRKQGLFSSTR